MSTPRTLAPSPALLPATLRLGAVHLTVSDLDRSVAYYQDTAGLRQHRSEDGTAALGTGGEDLLVLHEDPAAREPGRHAGLFHVALLYPSRLELSRTARRIASSRIPIGGASDHGVSEALYLRDPDGNGVELYVDRDPSVWPAPAPGSAEKVGMFTRALDVEDLLGVSGGEEIRRHAGDGLVVGHLHLHVGSIPQAVAFYRDVVGFEVMTTYPGASFLATGGYHHHLAVNTWAGEGVGPAPDHVTGLREWTVVLADDGEVEAVARRLEAAGAAVLRVEGQGILTFDPWGIALRISPASR